MAQKNAPGPNDVLARLMLARQAAQQAGRLLQEMQPTAGRRNTGVNLVTDADLAAEKAIADQIQQAFPADALLGEESAKSQPWTAQASDSLWIVDPLDGTNSYAHGVPHFSVSIAWVFQGRPLLGVVHDPNRQETFWSMAALSDGQQTGVAMCNDQPIQVSPHEDLNQCLIATGFYYDRGAMMRRTLRSMEYLFEAQVQGIRRFGSAALDLCWVACGRFDGYFEYQLSVWDFAAAWLILQNAGGNLRERDGSAFHLGSTGVLATNGRIDAAFDRCVIWT